MKILIRWTKLIRKNSSDLNSSISNEYELTHVVVVVKLVDVVRLRVFIIHGVPFSGLGAQVALCVGGFVPRITIFHLLHSIHFSISWPIRRRWKLYQNSPPSHPASSLHQRRSRFHNPNSGPPSPSRRSTCSISLGSCSLFESCSRRQRWRKQQELRIWCSMRLFWSPGWVLCRYQELRWINECESTISIKLILNVFNLV